MAFERDDLLRQVLAPIAEDPRFEVIVVDNSQSQAVMNLCQSAFPTVSVIRMGWNSGFARACNRGASEASSDTLLFLNQDCVATPEAIEACRKKLGEVNASILGCRLVRLDGSFDHAAKTRLPDPKDAVAYFAARLLGRGRSESRYVIPELAETDSGRVGSVSGAFMMIDRGEFFRLGAFDEAFWMYHEDFDLAARAESAGGGSYYFGGATVVHVKGGVAGERRPWWISREFDRGMSVYYQKHFRAEARTIRGVAVRAAIAMRTPVFSVLERLWVREK